MGSRMNYAAAAEINPAVAHAAPKPEAVAIAHGFLERLPKRVREADQASRLAVLCFEAEGLQPFVAGGLLDPAAVAEQISITADEIGLSGSIDADALDVIVRLATSPDEPEPDAQPPAWFVDTVMADEAEAPPAPSPSRRYRTSQSTEAAFWYVVSLENPAHLKAWLADHPRDVAHLLKLLEGK